MKKKLLAAAVVGALASPAAFAQTTVYGIIDVGYQNAKHAGGDVNKDFIVSGQKDRSRLGVRGSEDLAGGIYAMYQTEFTLTADTGATDASGMTSAITMVGLGSKAWGEFTLGRQYTHVFHNNSAGQAARTETFASAAGLMPRNVRASNSVKYSSPRFGGVTVGALWAPSVTDGAAVSEPTAADADTNYWDVGVIWRGPAFGAGAAYGLLKVETAAGETETTLPGVFAYFDNKAFGIYGAYSLLETEGPTGATTSDITAWTISGVFYFGGRNELYAMYGQREDEGTLAGAGNEASFWGIALMHRLSKRTTVYAGYGQVENDGPSTLAPNAFATGTAVAAGFDPRGIQIGLAHSF
jgi:predicted porin